MVVVDDDALLEAVESGADEVLQKPFNRKAYVKALFPAT